MWSRVSVVHEGSELGTQESLCISGDRCKAIKQQQFGLDSHSPHLYSRLTCPAGLRQASKSAKVGRKL